ncbi:hypothetical protein KI387_027604, partial [Taxus chinensis]
MLANVNRKPLFVPEWCKRLQKLTNMYNGSRIGWIRTQRWKPQFIRSVEMLFRYNILGIIGRLFKTHSAFPSKVSQVARKNRTRIVMQDNVAGSYATALAELAQSVKSLDAISRDIDNLSQYITNK